MEEPVDVIDILQPFMLRDVNVRMHKCLDCKRVDALYEFHMKIGSIKN
ncbi:MAG: hypothetical protein ISS36_04375 [Candidatus Aenigmarchaeota archaeon]|nr:hypothetical protein [Candidatus Aenigmarchaeota archaeon]